MTDQPMTEHQTDPATIAHHDEPNGTAENGAVAVADAPAMTTAEPDPAPTVADPPPAAPGDDEGSQRDPVATSSDAGGAAPLVLDAPPAGTPTPDSHTAPVDAASSDADAAPIDDALADGNTPADAAPAADTTSVDTVPSDADATPVDTGGPDADVMPEPEATPAAPAESSFDTLAAATATSTETADTDAETADTRVDGPMDLTGVGSAVQLAPEAPAAEASATEASAIDGPGDDGVSGEPVDSATDSAAPDNSAAPDDAADDSAADGAGPDAVAAEEQVVAPAAPVPPPSVLAAAPAAAKVARPVSPVPEHAPMVRPALTDPARWGRIDEDRNVFVRTADGERLVGSWQAGEPEEGLAHFARRFDDLLTEVELIAARLASGHGDPKQSLATVRQLKESLADAHVVGDVVGLDAKLDYLVAKAEQALGAAKEAREAARGESTARKQALVEEAEKIANEATQWKHAGDRLREILDEWKTIRGVDRKTDDALWKRFGKARDAFNRRRGSHFAEMDRQRGAAKTRKEEIVAEAEQLSHSTEWGATAGRYKQLMVDWKAAGRAPKDADDALWQRFRAAQDAFFARRSAAFTERDSELTDNARRKEELLAEAERIDPATDLEGARGHLHRLQERWDAIGHVPRERMRELEARLRAVEERVRGAVDAQWRRSDPETEARVAQFRERVEQFENQAAKARAAGDERRAKRADEQAAQWREWLAAAEQAVADR